VRLPILAGSSCPFMTQSWPPTVVLPVLLPPRPRALPVIVSCVWYFQGQRNFCTVLWFSPRWSPSWMRIFLSRYQRPRPTSMTRPSLRPESPNSSYGFCFWISEAFNLKDGSHLFPVFSCFSPPLPSEASLFSLGEKKRRPSALAFHSFFCGVVFFSLLSFLDVSAPDRLYFSVLRGLFPLGSPFFVLCRLLYPGSQLAIFCLSSERS